jgi:hypothetical protein
MDDIIDTVPGTLPGSIWKEYIAFGNSGAIQFSALVSLEYLDLSYNVFADTIPPYLGLLTNLKYVYMQGNTLHGTLPSSLQYLTDVQSISFASNSQTPYLLIPMEI